MSRLEMKNYYTILTGKHEEIPVLLSDKLDKYEYHTDQEITLSDQNRMTKQVKFTYSLFGKALEI